MSQQSKRVILAGLMVGAVGFITMIVINITECGIFDARCITREGNLLLPAFFGAMMAGMLFSMLFGRPGRKGWGMAVIGAVLTTLLGAMLGVVALGQIYTGTSVLTDPQVVFLGPAMIVIMFQEQPVTAMVWVGSMAAVHMILRQIFQKHTKV